MNILLFLLSFAVAVAPVAMNDPHWRITADESRLESYQGRDAMFLKGGSAWLDGASFQDGTVEFDVAGPTENGFHGLAFRAQEDNNFEHIYLRPHLSDKPDATQYQPVFNGNSAWQLYTGPRYTQQAAIAHDRWMHVKAAFRGKRLELTIDGQTVVFPELVRLLAAGRIGLVSSGAGGRFANVVVRPDDVAAPTGGDGAPPQEVPAGSIDRWRISSTFVESKLDPVKRLVASDWSSLKWDSLTPAVRGIANIGMIRTRGKEDNTVFAAVTLRAKAATTARVRIGFSDRVTAYVNGRPIFRGNDKFQTRDYRYLGTIGLFDELILPLERGDNEVWLAVSEDLGGWGVAMQLVDSAGIEVR